jgi:hypothetical protein
MTDTLQQIQERRAARKAALAELELEQRAIDLAAIDALEQEHGDGNIAIREVTYSEGLPVLAAVRCPTGVEMKRYKDRLREGAKPDGIRAAEEVASSCIVYPTGDDRAKLLAARPALLTELGNAATSLASGRAVEEGKG